jgi:hypothetical protein
MKATRVATFHDDYQRIKSGPPYPSADLPRDTSPGIHGWPPYYPNVTREVQWGVVQLSDCWSYYVCGIPINPVCISTQLNLVHWGQTIGPQSTQAGAATFGAPNMKIDHSQPSHPVFPTFSNCPARSHIEPPSDHSHKPHRTTIVRRGSITSGYQPLGFYW